MTTRRPLVSISGTTQELPSGDLLHGQSARTVCAAFDGQGSAPTAGTKCYVICPFAGTITGWRIVGDVTGSAVVDVWKVAYGSNLPTVSNTIAASAKPTLSSAKINKNDTLTGWTTSVAADDIFGFNVDSASTLTRITVELKVTPI